MNILHDAYAALLAGLTSYKPNTKEILWENEWGNPITVELIDAEKEKYIIREYWENGNKCGEEEYKNNKRHGKSIYWWENGNIHWEEEYHEGQSHGKSIGWYENGSKRWETEYHEGQRHGKGTGWYENGNKHWEDEYQNGQRHGKGIAWCENGRKHWEAEFQNDELIKRIKINRSRIMIIWNKIKSLVNSEAEYQDGEE